MATVSYDAFYTLDPTIFDDLQVPTQIDKYDLIDNILFESMELEALYPDPAVIKKAVEIWSKARIHSWQRIANALYKNYDPFINFTRDETRRSEYRPNLTNTNTGSGKGYNDAAFVEREKVVQEQKGNSATIETFHSEGDSAMYTPTDVADKETTLRIKYDVINIITREFINRFCIAVY